MSDKTEAQLLSPERLEEIKADAAEYARLCAIPAANVVDGPGPHRDRADLLADRAAFRKMIAAEWAKAIPLEPTINSDCADDWEMGMAYAASQQRQGMLAAATRLGLDL